MSTLILVATGSVSGVIGAAAMFIPAKRLRDDAKTFMERGEETFDKAEHLADEVERTRNMPWHYADEHVTGELIAVETHDLPALSAEAHEDEQAADEDDNHAGLWWLPLMTMPLLLARWWGYLLAWGDELVRRVRALRKPKPQAYTGRHWVADVQHTGQFPTIPAQRDGEVSA